MQKFELGAACQKPDECPRKEEQGLRQKTVPEDRIKHPQLFLNPRIKEGIFFYLFIFFNKDVCADQRAKCVPTFT